MHLLTLLRHAKSSWASETLADHERPLNERGVRDAAAVATRLLQGDPVTQVLCSTALRTRQTLHQLLSAGTVDELRAHIEPALYLADAMTMAALIEAAADDGHLLVIGHNPGIETLASRFGGRPIVMKTASLCRFERHDKASTWQWIDQLTPRG